MVWADFVAVSRAAGLLAKFLHFQCQCLQRFVVCCERKTVNRTRVNTMTVYHYNLKLKAPAHPRCVH